jgi:cyclophilin family peptidyl-prolyl cis-trans isomerase
MVAAVISTSLGDIPIELDAAHAPATVENFIRYARDGFCDGTIFHRLVPNFVIQGGGYTKAGDEKPTRAAIKNEAQSGLRNLAGTLSMARTSDPDSATSQFFISLKDNPALDPRPGSAGCRCSAA